MKILETQFNTSHTSSSQRRVAMASLFRLGLVSTLALAGGSGMERPRNGARRLTNDLARPFEPPRAARKGPLAAQSSSRSNLLTPTSRPARPTKAHWQMNTSRTETQGSRAKPSERARPSVRSGTRPGPSDQRNQRDDRDVEASGGRTQGERRRQRQNHRTRTRNECAHSSRMVNLTST